MRVKAIKHGEPINIPDHFECLADIVICAARRHPQKGITYFSRTGQEKTILYPELVESAKRCLHALNKNGINRKSVVILEIIDPLDFLITFFACVFGGIVVAPISHPISSDLKSSGIVKLTKMWEVLNKPPIIIEESSREIYENFIKMAQFSDCKLISIDELASTEESAIIRAERDDLAIIQFSSGSTNVPKGVMLTNKNILSGIMSILHEVEANEDDTVCSWLPHTHDMGLFGQLLVPIAAGNEIFICLPITFIRSPYLFLKKATEHKATWFCCTNHGFEWMIKNISDEEIEQFDLSELRVVFNGAEPISVSVLNEYIEIFSKAGFQPEMMRPAYGMAEATLAVCASVAGKPPRIDSVSRQKLVGEGLAVPISSQDESEILRFVHVGFPFGGISLRIADDEGNVFDEGVVGEVQIKGDAVTDGYFNNDDANKDLFVGEWLRTGDLGYMSDGSLVIRGRIKDIIIINGQNYYSQDLEEVLYSLGLFTRGDIAIVGLYNTEKQHEEVILFYKDRFDAEKHVVLHKRVAQRLYEVFSIGITHSIPENEIPKTTSGKLQRFELRKLYENGFYDEILHNIQIYKSSRHMLHEKPKSQMESIIRRIWSESLGIAEEDISVLDTFACLGGNSVMSYKVHCEIEEYLKRKIDTELMVNCRTIREAVQYLESDRHNTDSKKDKFSKKCESIAVTGIGLRMPDADSQEEFWSNLLNGKDSISKVSGKRKVLSGEDNWDDWIGEFKNIDMFDNGFFEIDDEAAKFMDPQQRIALEVAYEALEEAGMTPQLGDEQNIAVFGAVSANTYQQLVLNYMQKNGVDKIHYNTMINNLNNMVPSIISYIFNLKGDAINIDTACSSFLVTFNYAVDALKEGKFDGAVVVGSNLLANSYVNALSLKAGILSSSRFSKVFDEDADGTILGEGVIALYLEPLDKAVRERKNIYAVSKGGAVNNNGRTFSVMAPDPNGQYQAIAEAYANCNVDPQEISYIETHGAGTTIGDPIEIRALSKLFSNSTNAGTGKIGIGSVKTNIGHLLSAAGGAGLVKLLLCMAHKKLVPSLHMNNVNPALDLEKTPFYVVKSVADWNVDDDKPRKAGISSFGLGGTNAHAVLEEYKADKPEQGDFKTLQLLTLSAKTENSLKNMILSITDLIQKDTKLSIADMCFTRNRYRKHYSYRAAFAIDEVVEGKDVRLIAKGDIHRTKTFRVGLFLDDINGVFSNSEVASCGIADQYIEEIASYAKKCGFDESKLNSCRVKAFFRLYSVAKALADAITLDNIYGVGHGYVLAKLLNSEISVNEALDAICNEEPVSDSVITEIAEVDIAVCLAMSNQAVIPKDIYKDSVKIITQLNTESVESALIDILGRLYVSGIEPEWEKIYPDGSGRLISLPSYQFDRQRHWLEA